MNPLLVIGLILVAGYLAGIAANYFRLPRISGYIFTGLLLSPSVTGLLDKVQVEAIFDLTSELALAAIAYSIGGSLLMSQVKKLGKEILWITLTQGLGAMLFASLAMFLAGYFFPILKANGPGLFFSIILIMGTISVATAPAATMAIVHELRAKGPFTTTLLGVVALDDALTIILFSGTLTIVGQVLGIGTGGNLEFLHGIREIAGALIVGALGGIFYTYVVGEKRRSEITLVITLGIIFLVNGVSVHFNFSALLANMMAGFFIANTMKHSDELFHQLDAVEETLYCLFFVLAAAHFDLNVVNTSALLGFLLLSGRFAGKIAGTFLGGFISKTDPKIYKYLGITLLPKAGLSLGLIFLARPFFPAATFDVLLSAMLASTIMNEIISPPLVKWSLVRVGESHPG